MPSNVAATVKFDLPEGTISLDGSSPRLMVPAEALVDLLGASSEEAVYDFGHRIGTELGRRLAAKFADPGRTSIDAFAAELGDQLAVLGLGNMELERWGRGLIVRFRATSLAGGGEDLLAAIVEGALQRAMARDVRALVVGADEAGIRLLLLNEGAVAKARSWMAEGADFIETLDRLGGFR